MTEPLALLLREAADVGPVLVPAGLRDRARRRYRRRRAGAVVASALSVLLVAVLVVRVPHPTPPTPTYAGPGTAQALAAGTWQQLPDPPLPPRTGAVVVWTGSRLLVWGGAPLVGDAVLPDGAAYSPAAGSWTPLPPAPLVSGPRPLGVWTGQELVVLGRPSPTVKLPRLPATAAYRPATGTWRTLPDPPLSSDRAVLAWDGRRVLAVSATRAAALDPDGGGWTRLPDPPLRHAEDAPELTATSTGAGTYLQSAWVRSTLLAPGTYRGAAGQEALLLDGDRWREVPAAASPAQPLWTGRSLLSPYRRPFTGGSGGAVLDPGVHGERAGVGGAWTAIAPGPLDGLYGTSTWTGGALVTAATSSSVTGPRGVFRGGEGAAWDPDADRWTRLPDAPQRPAYEGAQVWTGTALLEVGAMTVPTPPSFKGVLVPRMRLLALVPAGAPPLAG